VLVPPVRASRLLSLPVRVDGILLGHVVDVILDDGLRRVLGLEVRCGDGEHRFLPLAGTHFRDAEVAVSSPLALLDAAQLAFYAGRSASFRALRAAPSHGFRAPVADVELDDRGVVGHVELHGATGS
jgi:hypothetical protein